MEQEEAWKPIKGFEGVYEVSNMGRIKSLYKEEYVVPRNRAPYLRVKQEKILNTPVFSNGYCVIQLCNNSTRIKCSVHRLVADAFIPNPRGLNEIDHINTIRSDNRAENLRWVTRSENHMNPITRVNHSVASKAAAEKRVKPPKPIIKPRKRIKEEKINLKIPRRKQRRIIQLSLSYEYISIYDSLSVAANKYNICGSQIRKCCDREMFSSAGYVWLYETDYANGDFKKHNLNKNANRTYARAINQYSLSGDFIKTWNCISEAAKGLNINGSHITQCCKGRVRQTGGFMWKYIEDAS